MKSILWINTFSLVFVLFGCQAQEADKEAPAPTIEKIDFKLNQFYGEHAQLDSVVNAIYEQMNDTTRVAQMVITSAGKLGKPLSTVKRLAKNNQIGGVLFLKGTAKEHHEAMKALNEINAAHGSLPLWYPADAEPTLMARRIAGLNESFTPNIELNTIEDVTASAERIIEILDSLGFQQNYAPVVDLSPNNEAIKSRSYGSNPDSVIAKSLAFIKTSQDAGIAATAKHFPGHGYVTGDTHKKTVFIDGELRELDVYKPLIEAGVMSIMVAHVTVANNEQYGTDDWPSSCSRVIVTDLLREEMGFEGIIVTDALNMMAATNAGNEAPFHAAMAGCDMILMPPNEAAFIEQVLSEMQDNAAFRNQIESSVKRIIRMKVCTGNY